MTNKYVISDLHLFHEKIIGYENRPFTSIEHMHKKFIQKWNNTVKNSDIVYNLGDVSFSNKEDTESIISQLNGYKILILGNHDRGRSRQFFLDCGFDEVIKHPIIIEGFLIMSHEPVYANSNMPYCNIHGHTHGTDYGLPNRYFNASVEKINYTPILLSEIVKNFEV